MHLRSSFATTQQQTLPLFKLSAIATVIMAGVMPIASLADSASQTMQNFDIPAQPLDNALTELADHANLKLLYQSEVVRNHKSHALSGSYTSQQALDILLKNTGLNYRKTGDHAITIEKKMDITLADASIHRVAERKLQPNTNTENEPTLLEPMRVTGEALKDEPEETVNNVNSPYNKDYRVTNASTATKTDTPIMETPYSVTVVSQQVLKDQQAVRIEDALKNVAGVQSSWTNGGQSDVFMMRGFQNTNIYRDGFLQPSAVGGGTSKREIANLERIEVLKGPGSVLFGRNEPGGVVNLVTKRPQATPYHSIQQQFGSYDFFRTTADSTAALTKDEQLLYRVNLSYENAGSFRDFVKTDSVFFAPSLTWNISDKTQANLDIEYQHFDNKSDSGVAPLGNRPAPVPINRQIGDPLNNKNRGDRTYVGVNWSHAFNNNWKLTHRFGAEFLDKTSDFTFFFGRPDAQGNLVNVNADFSDGNRGFNNAIVHQQNYYTTLNLTGKFNTGIFEHTTLWGFDYFVIDNNNKTSCCAAYPELVSFNIFNPTYLTSRPDNVFTPAANFTQNWYGVYLQDQIKFPFNVYGNVGVRYDNAESVNNDNGFGTTDGRVSPRGGLLWKPQDWLSVYGNYSQNFGPSNSLFNSPDQAILPPQTAEQWELGAKTEFFNGRLSAGFAYFDLTRKNMSVSDPINPNLSRAIGEQESRGYEFEAAGEVLTGWRVIGAYTHLAYANVNDDGGDGNTGNRLFNAPRHYGSLWNTYEFQNADLHGLKLGGGIVASSQSQGSNANTFQLPGYVTFNMLASYGVKVAGKNLTFQLNANNLLDKTYYTGTNTGSMIGFGQPRNFMGSVKIEF